ncbi:MAG: FAD-dependent oxidoreductase [Pseudomonadota bacterium]
MSGRRLHEHPILRPPSTEPSVPFTWNGRPLLARPGEMIASALFAAGEQVFGHHARDGAALGIFCANGQCGQCTVMADGVAVKACMSPVTAGLEARSVEGLPELPIAEAAPAGGQIPLHRVQVLIVGAGPAGLSASVELASRGVRVLVVDDKDRPGGKLVLQTHKFFGSIEDTRAGTRGIDLATGLAGQLAAQPSAELWLEATAVGVFADKRVGVVKQGTYHLVEPQVMLLTTGAREKQLPFPGHTLPGVYGAGAFQTLLNRDLVLPCRRLFILGGGNVGLIAAYHAMQAGIEVVGLVEALPEVGGYRVHADKIRRLGVPVHLRHTVVAAHGREHLEAVTVGQVDERFQLIPGTERRYEVDTLLVAVGLAPLGELGEQARAFGMPVFSAGDAQEIAEASAATFGGRIAALEVAHALGLAVGDVPGDWREKLEVLKARPGPYQLRDVAGAELRVHPVLHCHQPIPCNPCSSVCPEGSIRMVGDPILGVPVFEGHCTGCTRCVMICPGLAITLVDGRKDAENPLVTVPFELPTGGLHPGEDVEATDVAGEPLGRFPVVDIRSPRVADRTVLVRLRVPVALATRVAGFRVQDPGALRPVSAESEPVDADETIICRCEHVTAGEIRAAIRTGARDVNELKAELRVCMGACCGKNCPEHIDRIFRQEGVPREEVTSPTLRPLFVEVPLGVFAKAGGEE